MPEPFSATGGQGESKPSTLGESAPPVFPFHTNMEFFKGRRLSFLAAWAGVRYVIRTQPNAWIELAAMGVVIIAGLWLHIEPVEWAVIILIFGMILALEALNTAIETVVDLASPHYHPLARVAKDVAAGALLIAVCSSIGIAAFIFLPRIWALFAG